MAAFDCVGDMYDVALKPRLLRTLMRDHLPDEKRPFRDPRVILRIISSVKTHKLLSESFGDKTDKKLVKDWSSTVSAWVDRVLMLASSNSPAKCWAGVSLLGLICKECSSERFLESYSAWIEKLQSYIEPATESHMVKVASCASLADLLLRLGQYPARHGKGGFAEKLVQLSLNLLNEDSSEAIWDAVLHLIGVMVTLFPSAIQRHYDSAEATIISKIFSGKCSDLLLEKLSRCLAILPKSKGDESTWSLLMQRILLFINDYLKDTFQGLEEETKSYEGIRLLVPPGKNPPPPLADNKSKAGNRSGQTPIVSAMMICCSEMLKNSYPAQVSLPMQSLLALIERVLTVDGSVPQTSSLFVTAMQPELLCLGLPVLHSSVLDLLIALIKGVRSQILPRAAYIVQVITRYFKKCAVPGLRMKVYSVIKILLMSMGAGMAKNLEHEILRNALVDLKPDQENEMFPFNKQSNAAKASAEQPKRKKRKRSSTAETPEQHHHGDSEANVMKSDAVEHPELKIAALETLEALFTVGGALKFGRVGVDDLLISLAMNSFDHQSSSTEGLQLAALRALLASILSQIHQRPQHLAKSLELFRRGRQVTGSRVGEFCAHSILALEALIHPRALPLSDYSTPPPAQSSGGIDFNLSRSFQPSARRDSNMGFGLPESDDDIAGDSLMDVVKWINHGQDTATAKSSKENRKKSLSNGSSDENSQRNNETGPPAMVSVDKFAFNPKSRPPTIKSPGPPSPDPIMVPHTSGTAEESKEDTHEDEGTGLDGNVVVGQDDAPLSETREDTHGDECTGLDGNVVVGHDDAPLPASSGAATTDLGKGKELLQDPDPESDSFVFPDIIDTDPDSDDTDPDSNSDEE